MILKGKGAIRFTKDPNTMSNNGAKRGKTKPLSIVHHLTKMRQECATLEMVKERNNLYKSVNGVELTLLWLLGA